MDNLLERRPEERVHRAYYKLTDGNGCSMRCDMDGNILESDGYNIDQRVFFTGLNFEEHEIDGTLCFKGPDGVFYRLDHFDNVYVIECSNSEIAARRNSFEDAERFDDDLPIDQLIELIQEALRQYVKG